MLGAAVPPDCRVQRVQAVQRRAMLYNRPYRSQEEACLRAWLAPGGNASPADTSNGPLAEPAAAPAPRPAAAPALPWSPAPPDPRAAGSEGRGSVIVACRTVTYRAAPAGRRRLPAVPCSAVPCLCTMQRLTKTQTRRSKRPHDVGLREPPPIYTLTLTPPGLRPGGGSEREKKIAKKRFGVAVQFAGPTVGLKSAAQGTWCRPSQHKGGGDGVCTQTSREMSA